MKHSVAVICVAVVLLSTAAAEENPTRSLELPWGPVTRLASPDGSHVLFGLPYQKGINDGPQLWFEDTRTKRREMLMKIGGTLSAFWSPDGSAFVVTAGISDQAETYIYDAVTLARLVVGHEIVAADPGTFRFVPGRAHSYVTPERWENNRELTIRFHGHTDQPPVLCFNSRYRVNRAGSVEKLSENVFPVSPAKLCGE